jgi:hypothetical protein
MKLVCYPLADTPPTIRPAPRDRDWMDKTNNGYAYRCLPLVLANQHCWEILSQGVHEAIWNGGESPADIDVSSSASRPAAISHFGHGVLTFHVNIILRTDEGVNLFISGPLNRPKDAIAPLTGIIESDWMPYSFTMNWKFTRPHHRVRFEDGEPICSFFPVGRGVIESVEPVMQSFDSDPATREAFQIWSRNRMQMNEQLERNLAVARDRGWQKTYFQGRWPNGQRFEQHQVKLDVKEFKITQP